MTQIHVFDDYAFDIAPLSADDGGGFLITWPDLPGCMSDGDSVEEAIENGRDAFTAWMLAYAENGRDIPAPATGGTSGKFVQRVPKSLHARLAARAKAEGVSMNTLVATMLAENLGLREIHHR
ncbi:MAG TPA: type II toxin-antitoxin system HicB family antitoxin [Gammaproteobacteria bacterium]|nr:type II toxin-antitoxin system HicB family antitoxin [Gammaproteobacteria bacterium]